tara:strand:+ start:1038 stop:1625 length:588 start_codon:yes stop_codon:yes gene_type:complete
MAMLMIGREDKDKLSQVNLALSTDVLDIIAGCNGIECNGVWPTTRMLGLNPLSLTEVGDDEINNEINASDIIYCIGGNPCFMITELRSTGVSQALTNHIQKGKLYVGRSGGTMIVGKTIASAECEPNKQNGLGFIDASLRPHYNGPVHDTLMEGIERAIKISDGYFVTIEQGDFQMMSTNVHPPLQPSVPTPDSP